MNSKLREGLKKQALKARLEVTSSNTFNPYHFFRACPRKETAGSGWPAPIFCRRQAKGFSLVSFTRVQSKIELRAMNRKLREGLKKQASKAPARNNKLKICSHYHLTNAKQFISAIIPIFAIDNFTGL
jgi:hypothetical protein